MGLRGKPGKGTERRLGCRAGSLQERVNQAGGRHVGENAVISAPAKLTGAEDGGRKDTRVGLIRLVRLWEGLWDYFLGD